MAELRYPFTQEQANAAADSWGCNCGPAALAFACQKPLDAARYAIVDFDRKRYTSPSMMRAALAELRREIVTVRRPTRDEMFSHLPSLVRIQWTGPWSKPGVPAVAAYRHTHWVCCWLEGPEIEGGPPLVFDVNGGVLHVSDWENEIVPLLLPKDGDGKWHPTHVWRLATEVRR